MENDSNTIYEVSYLLLPVIAQEHVQSIVESLKEAVKSVSGVIISDEDPILIDLAYPMVKVVGTTRHKADSGYFGWIKFEMRAENIANLKKNLDSNDEILRYLIIKTVRENTLINGKMKLRSEERAKVAPATLEDEVAIEDVPAPEKEAILEDLDKSIDDLVIV